jgi:hypothetical protein
MPGTSIHEACGRGDVEAVRASLAADPAAVERLGVAARAFAERLSWERAAAATETHLERIIAHGGRP